MSIVNENAVIKGGKVVCELEELTIDKIVDKVLEKLAERIERGYNLSSKGTKE